MVGPSLGGLVIAADRGGDVGLLLDAACSVVVGRPDRSDPLHRPERATEPISLASLLAGLQVRLRAPS